MLPGAVVIGALEEIDSLCRFSAILLQGRQLAGLPVCFLAHYAPSENGSALKGKNLGNEFFSFSSRPIFRKEPLKLY